MLNQNKNRQRRRRCVLIGAMECERDLSCITAEDYVILIDGGYRYHNKIKHDLTIGDFDSLGFVPQEGEILQYPVKKDDTDMMLAVKEAIKRGFDDFILLGGIGGRLDHTIANIQTLAYLKSMGKSAIMMGEGQQIQILENETCILEKRNEGLVSVFAYGAVAEDVSIEGLLYEVSHVTLTAQFPLGVSNHWNGKDARITVGDGRLLLIVTDREQM